MCLQLFLTAPSIVLTHKRKLQSWEEKIVPWHLWARPKWTAKSLTANNTFHLWEYSLVSYFTWNDESHSNGVFTRIVVFSQGISVIKGKFTCMIAGHRKFVWQNRDIGFRNLPEVHKFNEGWLSLIMLSKRTYENFKTDLAEGNRTLILSFRLCKGGKILWQGQSKQV